MPQAQERKATPDQVYPYRRYVTNYHPNIRNGKPCVTIRFTAELHKQINAEAQKRGWSFSQMVRHLCEASIEGIE